MLRELQPKLQDIFNQIEQVLYGVEDLYERQNFGQLATKMYLLLF